MGEELQNRKRRSLRIVSLDLYQYIIHIVEERHNIHSYDLQADAIKEDNGLHVRLRYGDQFAHVEEHFFSFQDIREKSDELEAFVQSAADNCKEVMVADYFKMMKP